jgi:hypothetical protein
MPLSRCQVQLGDVSLSFSSHALSGVIFYVDNFFDMDTNLEVEEWEKKENRKEGEKKYLPRLSGIFGKPTWDLAFVNRETENRPPVVCNEQSEQSLSTTFVKQTPTRVKNGNEMTIRQSNTGTLFGSVVFLINDVCKE